MKLKSLMLGATLAMSSLMALPISLNTGGNWQVSTTGVGGSFSAVVAESPIPAGIWISSAGSNSFGSGVWVGTSTTDGAFTNPGDGALVGTYTYRIAIGSLLGGGGSFSLTYGADNNVTWSVGSSSSLGTTIATCNTNDCFTAVGGAPRSVSGSFGATDFLYATVVNTGASGTRNPSGLIVTGTADTAPEPSTYAMLGLGAAAMFIARLRRK